jgi:hypothetical protein
MFIDDNPSIKEHNTKFDNEEELSSKYDTNAEHVHREL